MIKEDYYYKVFSIIFFLIFPLVVIAPLGSWIPLVLSALSLIFFSKSFYKNLSFQNLNLIIISAFLWVIFSIIFLSKDIFLLDEALSLFFLMLSFLILISVVPEVLNFKKIVVYMTCSFIFSCLLIIIDLNFELGFKLWLSKNFDFSNMIGFFQFKSWENFSDFRANNLNVIRNYLDGNYDRGITSLIILSFPIILACHLYRFKFLTLITLLNSLILILFLSTFTVKISILIMVVLTTGYYIKFNFFKKYFLFFLTLYFFSVPFILGKLDFRKYSDYENHFIENKIHIKDKYCEKIEPFKSYIEIGYKTNILSLNCWYCFSGTCPNNKDYLLVKKSNTYELEPIFKKIKVYIFYKMNSTFESKLHRFMIWSYVKEKIVNKFILGHGFFSSKHIGNDNLKTEVGTNYQLIPLHAHNSILQIWLELGIVGLSIFLLFIGVILNNIFNFKKYSRNISTVAIASFFLVFFTTQSSYGLWQSWWLSIIFINIILYNFIFYNFKEANL